MKDELFTTSLQVKICGESYPVQISVDPIMLHVDISGVSISARSWYELETEITDYEWDKKNPPVEVGYWNGSLYYNLKEAIQDANGILVERDKQKTTPYPRRLHRVDGDLIFPIKHMEKVKRWRTLLTEELEKKQSKMRNQYTQVFREIILKYIEGPPNDTQL